MAKPEEVIQKNYLKTLIYEYKANFSLIALEKVLVVENEHGEVVREFMKDTDAINMYKSMRETLGIRRDSVNCFD